MANQYYGDSHLNRDTYPDNLDAAVELATMRPDQFSPELEELFHPIPADSTSYKMTTVGSILDLPKESDDSDPIPASIPAHGFDVTHNLVEYRQKVQVTRLFMEADRLGRGVFMASGLPRAMDRKKCYLRAVILDNAFTSGTGGDGVVMISNSHVPANPRGDLRDNLSTGALTRAAWHSLRLLADDQVDELGYPSPGVIDTLYVPTALRQTATELQTSQLDPETGLNTANVLVDFKIKVLHFISSTTAYFGTTGVMGPEKGLYYVFLKGAEGDIQDCKPSDNPDIIWAKRSRAVYTYGFNEATDFLYGSTGA